MDDPPAPDDKRVFLLLQKSGLNAEEAYTMVQEIQNMAAANLIARFEAKLDAQSAGITALQEHLRRERAMLWTVIALLGAAVLRYLITG